MKYKKLENIAEVRQGRWYPNPKGESSDYYLMRSGNINTGIYKPYPPFAKIKIDNNIRINQLSPNDILLCHMGSNIGKVCIFHKMDPGSFVCNQTITIIRSLELNPVYLFAYLSSYVVSTYLSISSKDIGSTTGKYIAKKDVMHLPILIPSKKLQEDISNEIASYIGLQEKSFEIKSKIESVLLESVKSSKNM